MKTSQTGLQLIRKHEGLRLDAYRDPANIWTIGYGHTKTARSGQRITREQAETLLLQDAAQAEQSVKALVKVPLKQNEFDALVSLVFNIGAGNFAKSTLLKKLNQGSKGEAAAEFEKWNKARVNGQLQTLPGLITRRRDERQLFENVGGKAVLSLLFVAAMLWLNKYL